MSSEDARAILRRVGLAPKKGFGQNFLISMHVVESIARACVPDREIGRARVIELGAGLGVLTHALAARAREVVAVERDRDLVPVLNQEFESLSDRVRIVEGDAQTIDVEELLPAIANADEEQQPPPPRVIAGNLPYQITGRLLERAVSYADVVDRVVFMVQLEVADRLAAEPSSKAYGALTVFMRAAFRVEKLFDVSRGSFHPSPDVTSAVVLLEPLRPRITDENETFRALVKGAFGMRRKTLRNAWRSVADVALIAKAAETAGVSLDARGETLDVEAFAKMSDALRALTR